MVGGKSIIFCNLMTWVGMPSRTTRGERLLRGGRRMLAKMLAGGGGGAWVLCNRAAEASKAKGPKKNAGFWETSVFSVFCIAYEIGSGAWIRIKGDF